MPTVRYKISQAHYPGCWRYASHWYCATDFVHRFREAAKDLLQASIDFEELGPNQLEGALTALQQLVDETDEQLESPDG